MANALTNLDRTVFEVFEETLAQGVSDFQRVGPVYRQDSAKLEFQTDQSGGGFTAYTAVGTSATKDITSGKVSFNSSPKAKIEKLTWSHLKDNPQLAETRARSLANRAMADIMAIWGAGMEALFSTSHPLTGTGAGQVGSSKNYLDTAMGVSGLSQSNLLTAPLSRSALVAAIETMRRWKSWGADQVPLNLGADGSNLVLCCGAADEDLARSLVGSQVQSAEMQINTLSSRIQDIVVYPWATDDDDWFLVDRGAAPVGLWLREPPMITGTWDSSLGHLEYVMTARFHADFVYSVEGAGIVGSNVA